MAKAPTRLSQQFRVYIETIPSVTLYNCIEFMFELNSTCRNFLFFCCTFVFVGQLPLLIIQVFKVSHACISGREGGNVGTPVLFVCKLNCRCVAANHWEALTEVI